MDRPLAVALVTLGCPKNEVDSDKMKAVLLSAGHEIVEDRARADIVIVNTCAFIQEATEESIEAVLECLAECESGDDGGQVVVTGCMASRYSGQLADALPEVAAFVPIAEQTRLVAVLESLTGSSPARASGAVATRTPTGPSAYLRISDGCDRTCTYCAIPSIRGPHRSVPLQDLLAEARELLAGGAREIVVVGQDITQWGKDLLGGKTLADAIQALAAVPGVEWLRLMYLQPDGITDELLGAIAENPAVCRYLDIPLQHASGRLLRAMGRPGDATAFLSLLARIRAVLPDAVLRTTVIAGFPGETRDDVRILDAFLREARFDYVGVFAYSPEEGTVAYGLPDQVSLRTRRARAQRLRDLADEIGLEQCRLQVNRNLEVLVEGTNEEGTAAWGRWRGQAPQIDGVITLDRGDPGSIVNVRTVDAIGYDLEGTVM